jgi:UDPglucose 6-dehydrogenase
MEIGFFGLSHLGLNYLAANACKGHKVIGYDRDNKLIKDLTLGKKLFKEPFLFENLDKYKKNIKFTNNLKDLKKIKIIFISSDVKTDSSGKSNLKFIKRDIDSLRKDLSDKNLIIMSQVNPGFTKDIAWNKDKLFYQVETLVFGDAFKRALNPERIILGTHKPLKKISNDLKFFYRAFNCPIIKTDYSTAELIKISINLYLISSVTTTNLISKIVKKIGGCWSDLENSLRLDKRIGKFAYLKPGLGISGGNLERDLQNIIDISEQKGISTKLFKIWKENSLYQKNWAYSIYKENAKKTKKLTLGVLGLAYKENTDSLKNSPAIHLINRLKNKDIYVFDPVVKKIIKKKDLIHTNNVNELINEIDILFIMTPWKIFKNIDINLLTISKIKIIIDPYGILTSQKTIFENRNIKYFSLT